MQTFLLRTGFIFSILRSMNKAQFQLHSVNGCAVFECRQCVVFWLKVASARCETYCAGAPRKPTALHRSPLRTLHSFLAIKMLKVPTRRGSSLLHSFILFDVKNTFDFNKVSWFNINPTYLVSEYKFMHCM